MQRLLNEFWGAASNDHQEVANEAHDQFIVESFNGGANYKQYLKVVHNELQGWLLDEFDMDVYFYSGCVVLGNDGRDIEFTPEDFEEFFFEVVKNG